MWRKVKDAPTLRRQTEKKAIKRHALGIVAAAVWLAGTRDEHVTRQYGIDHIVSLVPDIALQAKTRFDTAGVYVRGYAGTHCAEVPDRKQGDAVHAVRTQIDDAPVSPILVEYRLCLEFAFYSVVSGFPHVAHILP